MLDVYCRSPYSIRRSRSSRPARSAWHGRKVASHGLRRPGQPFDSLGGQAPPLDVPASRSTWSGVQCERQRRLKTQLRARAGQHPTGGCSDGLPQSHKLRSHAVVAQPGAARTDWPAGTFARSRNASTIGSGRVRTAATYTSRLSTRLAKTRVPIRLSEACRRPTTNPEDPGVGKSGSLLPRGDFEGSVS